MAPPIEHKTFDINAKQVHKLLGRLLALPIFAWAITGFVFLIQPGYEQAYAPLAVKTYPIQKTFSGHDSSGWHEAKLVRTALGYHLIARSETDTRHLDASTGKPWPPPDGPSLQRLLEDAVSIDPARYGSIVNIQGNTATTDTGVTLKVNWQDLTLSQSGHDTRRIDLLYRIHYLQWSPGDAFNTGLGVFALIALCCLTALGLFYVRQKP